MSRGRAACWLLLAGLAGHTVLGLLAALPRPRPRPWRGPALRVADPLEALGAPHELAGLEIDSSFTIQLRMLRNVR